MNLGLLLIVLPWTAAAEYPRAEILINADEVTRNVARLRILDTRSKPSYLNGHIPGAVWVDSLGWSKLFNSEPTAEAWGKQFSAMGIDPKKPIVVYGDADVRDAARIWWILRYWGCTDVRLLNGGWPSWVAAGGKPETTEQKPTGAPVTLQPIAAKVASKEQLLNGLKTKPPQIVDSRSFAEHCGQLEMAKRSGAIPGSIHLDWAETIDSKSKQFKTKEQLAELLRERKIDLNQPVVTYCQSGGRAAVVAFVLELMGGKQVANYYKSWSEWGNEADTPIITPAPPVKR